MRSDFTGLEWPVYDLKECRLLSSQQLEQPHELLAREVHMQIPVYEMFAVAWITCLFTKSCIKITLHTHYHRIFRTEEHQYILMSRGQKETGRVNSFIICREVAYPLDFHLQE